MFGHHFERRARLDFTFVSGRTWYGRKKAVPVSPSSLDLEESGPEVRPAMLYAPIYNGLAAGLSICE